MFDLSDEVSHRDPLGMIRQTRFLSSEKIDLTIYASRSMLSNLPAFGSNVRVVAMDKEELPMWKHHAAVDKARDVFWPTRDSRAPTGSHLITSSKHHLICKTITDRFLEDPDAWIYWIDFGKDFFSLPDVEAICGFADADVHLHLCNVVDPALFRTDLRTYFESYRFSVCGGLVGARQGVWLDLSRRLDAVFERHLDAGVGHGEEQLYNHLLQASDFLESTRLHLSIGDYQQLTTNLFGPRENKGHCTFVLRRMAQTGRRDLLGLVLPYLSSDPHLQALAKDLMDTTIQLNDDASETARGIQAPPSSHRVFRPAFSPGSCYLLHKATEEAAFAANGGAPEARLIDWARQFIRTDQTFIDVGAHVGTWAQHFAQKCRRVVAFEPQPSTYKRLVEGIALASLQNIVCHDVALGATGEVDLHVVDGGSTLHHRSELGQQIAVERVRAAQLDDYEFENVGLIKIDAEGAEADILRGAKKTLEAHRYPTLLLEAWTADWYADQRAALIKQLEELGYAVQTVMNCPEMLLAEHHGMRAEDAARSRKAAPGTPALVSSPVLTLDRPLLGLVMIVKNEAKRIAQVLASYRPYINAWTILDTGSTDGTQDMIRADLADIPGTLFEEPFVDFATSRNRALELHGTSTIFSIMPNGDVLEGGADLVKFLEGHKADLAHGSYRVRISPGHYYHPLVMRTGFGWRYKWRTHECAVGPNMGPHIEGVTVFRDRGQRTSEEWKVRWERDVVLLNLDREADPNDPRPYFYLGQTHECLGQYEEALSFFQKRATMGGYFDEVYEAKYRIGKMMEKIGRPWAECQQAYLEAFAHDPRRAEPLYAISQYWYDKGGNAHAVSRIFAAPAAEMPKPATDLFLDEDVYTWKAADRASISSFYSGYKAQGRDFAEQAVSFRPSDERLRSNRAYFAQSMSELFGARAQAIDFAPEAGWQPSNPSIYVHDGKLRCVVRTVNYKIVNGRYVTPPQDIVIEEGKYKGWQVIRTRNFLLDLDSDLKTVRTVEMIDKTDAQRTSYPIKGFEDARLFFWKGKWRATSTVCDFTEDGRREIALLTIDDEGAVISVEPLRGPWSEHVQKNWMPVIDGDRAKFIYATSLTGDVGSTTIFDLVEADDPDAAKLAWHVAGRYAIGCAPETTFGTGRLRGGSQAVRVDGGWIVLVHDVAFPGAGNRMYLHRFVMFDENLQLVSMSDPFYFEKLGIEFCAGLTKVGDNLVASYAVNDGSARLGIFDLSNVRKRLRKDFVI